MPNPNAQELRELILSIAHEQQPRQPTDAPLQTGSVLGAVVKRLAGGADTVSAGTDLAQAILTQWHDLMRTGYFAWGYNLANPNPPFFHFTDRGRRALERLSRDPGNPAGPAAMHSLK